MHAWFMGVKGQEEERNPVDWIVLVIVWGLQEQIRVIMIP